jgi:hypothetical protein
MESGLHREMIDSRHTEENTSLRCIVMPENKEVLWSVETCLIMDNLSNLINDSNEL